MSSMKLDWQDLFNQWVVAGLAGREPACDPMCVCYSSGQCRASGEIVRELIDCLIAAIAIRNDVIILH